MSKCVFAEGKSCKALSEKYCTGCPFRKTKEELEDGRDRAAELFYRLSPEKRKAIRKKYYAERSGDDGLYVQLSLFEET